MRSSGWPIWLSAPGRRMHLDRPSVDNVAERLAAPVGRGFFSFESLLEAFRGAGLPDLASETGIAEHAHTENQRGDRPERVGNHGEQPQRRSAAAPANASQYAQHDEGTNTGTD